MEKRNNQITITETAHHILIVTKAEKKLRTISDTIMYLSGRHEK